ncbi:hypothetical protein [Streptococcus agalactiae]
MWQKKALDSAKVADRTRNEGLAQLKQDVSTAQTHQTQSSARLTRVKKHSRTELKRKPVKQKLAYDKASQALSSRNTIRLSADYIQALTDYAASLSRERKSSHRNPKSSFSNLESTTPVQS